MGRRCGCHCCRVYADCDDGYIHPRSELLKARHLGNGRYYWGNGESKGRWVKICKGCIDSMSE